MTPTRRNLLAGGAAAAAAAVFVERAHATYRVTPRGQGIVPVSSLDVWRASWVNTKSFYGSTVYGYTDGLIGAVLDLHPAGVREAVATGSGRTTQARFLDALHAAGTGIGWHGTVANIRDAASFTEAEVRTWARTSVRAALIAAEQHAPMLRSFEPANEVDAVGDCGPDWARNAAILTAEVRRQVDAHPTLSRVAVTAPSTRTDLTAARATALGDALAAEGVAGLLDLGNPHTYYYSSPGDKLAAMLTTITPISGSLPAFVSEAGTRNNAYDAAGAWVGGDLTNDGMPVPEQASAIYGPRSTVEFYTQRATHCRFELLDDVDPVVSGGRAHGAHLGLIAMTRATVAEATPGTWRAKPEFAALRTLHATLYGDGTEPTLRSSGITVTAPAGVKYVLVKRGDGVRYLLLWRDVDVFAATRNAGGGTWIDVPPVDVTVTRRRGSTVVKVAGELVVHPVA